MLRITKETDYGIVLLIFFARAAWGSMHNARDLAADARLPLPMASKILKRLARYGILESHRGVKGGYSLARRPSVISVAEIIEALDGPIGLTECSVSSCDRENGCPGRGPWQRINKAVRMALENVTLADMAAPEPCAGPGNGNVAPALHTARLSF